MKLQLLKLLTILTVFTISTAAKECDFVKPTVELPENYSSNLNILEIATRALSYTDDGIAFTTDMTELQKVDRRKKKTKSSPAYLDAVGKITVKRNDGYQNTC